jgi:hypothetical protein
MVAVYAEVYSTENGDTINGYAVSRPDRQFLFAPVQGYVKVVPAADDNEDSAPMIVRADRGLQMNRDAYVRLFIA